MFYFIEILSLTDVFVVTLLVCLVVLLFSLSLAVNFKIFEQDNWST